MKIYLTFMMLICIIFTSCKKEQFRELSLDSTMWEGSLTLNTKQNTQKIPIQVYFKSSSYGEYYLPEDATEKVSPYSINSNLIYEQKNKDVFISGGYNNVLTGTWLVSEKSSDRIKMIRKGEFNKNDVWELKIKKDYDL